MPENASVLITLVAYKLVLLGLGFWANRRITDEGDYLLGGRGLGPWVAAISASASSSSVWTLLGVTGFAYRYGLGALWLFPGCVGGFALNWYLVAPRLRRASAEDRSVTLTEFLVGPQRGPEFRGARIAASLVLVFSLTLYVGAQFRGGGDAFQEFFDVSAQRSLWIGAGIVLAYTLIGGFWAVSLTDTLQGLLMALTAVALPIAALIEVGGFGPLFDGISSLAQTVPGYDSLVQGRPPLGALLGVSALLAIGIGYPGQPHVVNRFMALRDERSVRAARRIAMAWAILVYAGTLTLGLCARQLVEQDVAKDALVFYRMIDQLFPELVAGVMLAAVLSAILSTADSQLLVAASAVSHDLGWRLRRGSDQASAIWTSRVVVTLVCAVAVAIASVENDKLFDSVLFAWSVVGNAFGPLLLVTLWVGPVAGRHALAAVLIGAVGSGIAYQFPVTVAGAPFGKGGFLERIAPFAIALLVARLGARRAS